MQDGVALYLDQRNCRVFAWTLVHEETFIFNDLVYNTLGRNLWENFIDAAIDFILDDSRY